MNSAVVIDNTVIFYTSAEDVSGQSQQELHEIEKLLEKQGWPMGSTGGTEKLLRHVRKKANCEECQQSASYIIL